MGSHVSLLLCAGRNGGDGSEKQNIPGRAGSMCKGPQAECVHFVAGKVTAGVRLGCSLTTWHLR